MKLIFALVLTAFLLLTAMLKVPLNPKYDYVTTERNISFKVFGFADKVKVDDSIEFVSPVVIGKPFILDLDPGIYYWKADDSILIGKFTIVSEVNVGLEKLKDKYGVSNLGNTPIDLEFGLTGAAVLDSGERIDLKLENNSRIIASQR